MLAGLPRFYRFVLGRDAPSLIRRPRGVWLPARTLQLAPQSLKGLVIPQPLPVRVQSLHIRVQERLDDTFSSGAE